MGEGVRQRFKKLSKRLLSEPYFPLVFIAESVKATTYHVIAKQPPLDVVAASGVMAAGSVVGWLYTTDDVAWGLKQASEKVEEVTDDKT